MCIPERLPIAIHIISLIFQLAVEVRRFEAAQLQRSFLASSNDS